MNKLKIALNCFAESLVYMFMALIALVSANYLSSYMPWWAVFAVCMLVCLLMAFCNYQGKVYGFGFEEEEDDER